MDVNFINPVLSAFAGIMPQIGFSTVEKKKVSLCGSTLNNKGLIVNIGVMGPLRGSILIGMGIESAVKFASKMMAGMQVVELDLMAQSAISEMSNMVCANACTNFVSSGITGLDISPPTLFLGKDAKVNISVSKAITVEFLVDEISVDIFIGLA